MIRRRRSLWGAFFGTVAWCFPIAVLSQVPNFGAMGAGGMPKCLHEVNSGVRSDGEVVLAESPYSVWVARKIVGQGYREVTAWQKFGPWKLKGGRRYVFTGDGVADNLSPTSVTLSSALASLHLENREVWPAWMVITPPPPGCGAGTAETDPSAGSAGLLVAGAYRGADAGRWIFSNVSESSMDFAWWDTDDNSPPSARASHIYGRGTATPLGGGLWLMNGRDQPGTRYDNNLELELRVTSPASVVPVRCRTWKIGTPPSSEGQGWGSCGDTRNLIQQTAANAVPAGIPGALLPGRYRGAGPGRWIVSNVTASSMDLAWWDTDDESPPAARAAHIYGRGTVRPLGGGLWLLTGRDQPGTRYDNNLELEMRVNSSTSVSQGRCRIWKIGTAPPPEGQGWGSCGEETRNLLPK